MVRKPFTVAIQFSDHGGEGDAGGASGHPIVTWSLRKPQWGKRPALRGLSQEQAAEFNSQMLIESHTAVFQVV